MIDINECCNDFDYTMSRYEVLKYSGCLRRIIVRLIVIIALIACVICVKTMDNIILQIMIMTILLSIVLPFIIMFVSDLILMFKILRKKYKIITKKVLSLTSKRPFDEFSAYNKVIVFDRFRLSVEEQFADGLSIGDLITMVFADGIVYPIITIKRELVNEMETAI